MCVQGVEFVTRSKGMSVQPHQRNLAPFGSTLLYKKIDITFIYVYGSVLLI